MDGFQILCWAAYLLIIGIPSLIGVIAQANTRAEENKTYIKAEAEARWDKMVKEENERLARGEKYKRCY